MVYECLWVVLTVYECLGMFMNVYECLWMFMAGLLACWLARCLLAAFLLLACLLLACCLLLLAAVACLPGWIEGVRWRREFRTSCCGQWWPWVLRLTTHESGVVRGVVRGSFGGSFGCIFLFVYLLLFLSHRLLLLLFSLFPSFTQFYSFSNQTIVAEWLFVMQSSAGRRVVCSARGGLSRVCNNGTLYPSNEGNPLVFWWIAVTLLWPGRGDCSASGKLLWLQPSTVYIYIYTYYILITCNYGSWGLLYANL